MEKIKILFFTTALEHTTFRKTAEMLRKEGADVKMFGFTRNNFPISSNSQLPVYSFGTISHGNYLTRIVRLLKIVPFILREGKKADVVYNFTLDTLILSRIILLFRKKVWVYQIQDIRSVFFGKAFKNKVFRFLDKSFINKVDLVVVSSINFYNGFIKPNYQLPDDKVLVIENKLYKPVALESVNCDLEQATLTIGYFGVMRCLRSWLILKSLAIENPKNVKLYLRGKPSVIPKIKSEVLEYDNIHFGGRYKSPEDLNYIYGKADIIWAAYPFSESLEGNWKYARTIRFYEALAFGKPVIVQKGTPQEIDVLENQIGLVIDMADIEDVKLKLSSITKDDVLLWKNNIKKLPRSYYYHTDEYENLLTKLTESIHE